MNHWSHILLSRIVLTIAAALVVAAPLRASGGLSFFGIVERVVFEPAETNAARGYLYFRVRSDVPGFTTDETPANPATYQTETGIVKLSDSGSHAAVIELLRAALPR